MRQYLKNEVFKISKWVELILSVIITIAVIGGTVWLVRDLVEMMAAHPGTEEIYGFVGIAFNLVICIEFIKMLCKHTPDTLVEVLMFAIARQMIVEHTTPLENLIGISAIAVLFAIRKFLFKQFDDVDRTIFLPSQKISDINQLIHVGIPEEFRGETLGDLMEEYVEKGERGFQVGITRTSLDMAISILRKFSACCSSIEENLILPSLVTPSTRSATSAPKFWRSASKDKPVSSTTSCSSAAMTESVSRPKLTTRQATAMG